MTDLLTDALAAAQQPRERLLSRLERWVRTNSFTANVEGVNAVGEQLAEAFVALGLTLERRKGEEVGDHLCFRTPAWESAARGDGATPGEAAGRLAPRSGLLLVGHHDTVFPPGTFEVWEREGDLLRGPGVLDMKGGLLVAWAGLAALAEVGALAALPLAVVSVADEEIGSPESRPFLEGVARDAGAALVFESGREGDRIVTRRKGTGKLFVTARGRAAHAGNHHAEGVNAIRALARFIDRLEGLTDYERGVTVNVGIVSGGSSANTVPAHAECAADFRLERVADGVALMRSAEALARTVERETGATLVLRGGVRRPPLERTAASAALFDRYAACAAAAGLGHEECPLVGGGSDANTVGALGVPAIDGLGPRGRGFHTHDEHIEVSSLAPKVEALIRFLVSWPREPLDPPGVAAGPEGFDVRPPPG
jgi:glutamate carboxypeptidase